MAFPAKTRFMFPRGGFVRILYVTAIKPTTPNGVARFDKKLAAYVEAGVEVGVVCGIDAGDHDVNPPAGVTLFPVRFKTSHLPFSIVDALDEVPLPSVHRSEEVGAVRSQLEAAFASTIDEAIASFAPDVIVCSHLTLMTSIALEHAGGIPVAGISHSVCFHEFLRDSVTRNIIDSNLRKLDIIFACCERQREFMIDTFDLDADKVRVLYGSCDTDTFTMDGHRSYHNATEPSINIVYSGKFTYKNGLQSLLNAVGLLPCRPDTVTVRLCGKTDNSFQQAALELLVRENPQRVELAGWLDVDELAEEYRRAQVYVLPAFYDEFPLKILEALACECKVVTTDLPGLRDWIEESVPGASVTYVKPPRMQGLDEPLKCDIADFEKRMSDAIKEAVLAPLKPVDVSRLSWKGRAAHVIEGCAELLDRR